MISGRCGFSSILRTASELSKKPGSHGRLFFPIDVPFTTINVRHYRSDVFGRFSFPTRMASTSTRDPKMDDKASAKHKNRLAYEKSPYLLQHATNPVDWYPWGDEALEKARKEDKLIFLSVGYSTCHWCHVMERESFENKEIAQIMNHYFVNIKVDREERPDIDRIYMIFIQMKGTSGWPMSVFLTPDLKPVLGGTYFPPDDSNPYRPGFKTVLLHVAKEWNENRSKLLGHGNNILEVLKELFEKRQTSGTQVPPLNYAKTCVKQLTSEYDPEFGGFRGSEDIHSPKFPQPVNFNFLFHMYAREPTLQECLDMCVNTLTKMAYGGIHDHVGQGFARYSVDGEWHVPHFEKMLYDQAQLLQSYADAFVATKNPFFSEIVDDIATYVIRDLRHKEGGFYSAEDADSLPEPNATAKREGAFYVWTHQDITRLLSADIPGKSVKLSDLFCHHFNIKKNGNVRPWQDPHGELKMQNVLIVYDGIEKTAERFNMTIDEVKNHIQEACRILFEERSKRPRPHLDDKIVTAWNGLMISGLSRAGATTNNQQYIDYAIDAAKFLQKYLYDKSAGVLLRSCYRTDGDVITQTSVPIHGFHDDYAFTVKGLLDLYEATFDAHWLEFAEELQIIQDDLFWDAENGGYYSTTTSDPSVLLRLKSAHDGAEPAGNSIACGNLLRLAVYLNSSELKDKAERLLISFRKILKLTAIALPQMVSALLHYHDDMTQIYIAGKLGAKDTDKLLRVIHERLIPGKVLFFADHDESDNILFHKSDVIAKMKPLNGQATAYVCRHRECSLPVTSPKELASLLDERR